MWWPLGKSRLAIKSQVKRLRRLVVEPLEGRCLLATLPDGFTETPVAAGLSEATAMEFAPNGDLWVLEQDGLVKRFQAGSTSADVVGNIALLGMSSIGERGLLGIAFDPLYATTKQVYLYYTSNETTIHNRISRFTVNDANAEDYFFASTDGVPNETTIIDLDNLSASNHNGGAIHFGPDGMLYAAVGDNAVSSNAQVLTNTHGKILRMDRDGNALSTNPFFAVTEGKDQTIWALGLRNPFTFAFQPDTGRMFINDVGQVTWEEINDGIAGSNYGWPNVEGPDGTPPNGPGTYRAPVYSYEHGSGTFEGFAITGGAFYNPATQEFPAEYSGDYFFADFVMDWINVLDIGTGNVTRFATNALGTVDIRVTNDGSLYYLARGANQVFRVNFPLNDPPTISPIGDQTVEENGIRRVSFTIGDPETSAGSLNVSVISDDATLFSPQGLIVGGAGASRTLDLRPAAGQTGSTTITVGVSDGEFTTSVSFRVTVFADLFPWNNGLNVYDADGDEEISANDALEIINNLNAFHSRPLPRPDTEFSPPPFFDVVPDNFIAPNDALEVINFLNANPTTPAQSGAEAEPHADPDAETGEDLLTALIAMDIAQQATSPRRRSVAGGLR
jgi:glucose/arabinose dehydrogenase